MPYNFAPGQIYTTELEGRPSRPYRSGLSRLATAYDIARVTEMAIRKGLGKRKRNWGAMAGSMGAVPYVRAAKKQKQTGAATKNPAPGGPITTQFDYKVFRGKKRLSRRQKKWKGFVRKVHKATEQNDKSHFLQEANNAAATIVGIVGASFQQILPTSAAGDDYNLQLSAVGNNASGPLLFIDNLRQQKAVTTVAAGTLATTTPLKDVKYKLLGASCTFSFKNIIAFNIFVDIYECVASSDITDVNFLTARAAWNFCLANNLQTDQLAVPRAQLQANFGGATPYQAPGFANYWKIIKKTRVLCAPASKTNYTYYTRPRYINNSKVIGQYATKGLTKDIIIVVNPTYNGDTAAVNQINVEWCKSYTIKCDDIPGLQTQWGYNIPY